MAVHAHPDDESSKGAATMARYAVEGIAVLVVTCTGGERGDILNPAMDASHIRRDIAGIRRMEMARACQILGVSQRWLGFVDSGLPDHPSAPLPEGCFARQPVSVATEPLVRAMREFRPHVVLTYDEDGGYPHPDHVMCNRISLAGFAAAGSPDLYPGSGEPWQPLKLYYHVAHHADRYQSMLRHGLDPASGPVSGGPVRWPITTRIECADHFATRDRALRAHATQIEPDGAWFACPPEIERAAWPTEDYHLAWSLVAAETPETDLFAGVSRQPLPVGGRTSPLS
jgi:mycothiol S-conjugate amidase